MKFALKRSRLNRTSVLFALLLASSVPADEVLSFV